MAAAVGLDELLNEVTLSSNEIVLIYFDEFLSFRNPSSSMNLSDINNLGWQIKSGKCSITAKNMALRFNNYNKKSSYLDYVILPQDIKPKEPVCDQSEIKKISHAFDKQINNLATCVDIDCIQHEENKISYIFNSDSWYGCNSFIPKIKFKPAACALVC